MCTILIRTFGYGVALADRVHGPDGEASEKTVAEGISESGIRHHSLTEVPGNPDRVFFIMENADPPHPFQSAQLHEISNDLLASARAARGPELMNAARLLGLV